MGSIAFDTYRCVTPISGMNEDSNLSNASDSHEMMTDFTNKIEKHRDLSGSSSPTLQPANL